MSSPTLPSIPARIIAAPMAGGPTTPQLVAAVGEAGGLGFLAAGYLTPQRVAEQVDELRALSDRPFGVNIFAPVAPPSDAEAVTRYARTIGEHARRLQVQPGELVHSDDHFEDKCAVVLEARPDIVTFTFGLPEPAVLDAFHAEGIPVGVTVGTPDEAERAESAGADVLVLQGHEAGSHRGGLSDDAESFGLLPLLRLTSRRVDVPLIAAGGLADGAGIAAVLAAGASAAMLGTAFLRCPEAGTSRVHADSLATDTPTVVTRAFTGRNARAIANAFTDRFTDVAPSGYPAVHYLTSPIRAKARADGDPESLNLWAGQSHILAREVPAAQLVRELKAETTDAVRRLHEAGAARE